MINPLAAELNQTIKNSAPVVYGMLSRFGKEVFFPKGILHQSALARKQAKKISSCLSQAKSGITTFVFESTERCAAMEIP